MLGLFFPLSLFTCQRPKFPPLEAAFEQYARTSFSCQQLFSPPGSFFPPRLARPSRMRGVCFYAKPSPASTLFFAIFKKLFRSGGGSPSLPGCRRGVCFYAKPLRPSTLFFAALNIFFRAVQSPRPVRRADRVNRHLSIHCQ